MLLRKSFAVETRRSWFRFSRGCTEAVGSLKLGSSRALLCLIALLGLGPARADARGFVTAPTYPAGTQPNDVVVGDFNEDGIPDLVVVNFDSRAPGGRGGVSMLLGKGDGSFQAPLSYVIRQSVWALATGDFNGDGHADLAVLGQDSGGKPATYILLGNGDGTFQAAQTFAAGPWTQITVGDFNGDGILDLALGNLFVYGFSIFLGNGDGTFHSTGVVYRTKPEAKSMAVADFNGDGRLDIAVANGGWGTVSIFLGKGDGSFEPATTYPAGGVFTSLAVGDFNSDGIPDLVMTNNSDGMSVLLGKGDGTFQPAQSYVTGLPAYSVAVGDFNGDGHLDVVLGGRSTVSVLLGKGDGTFQAAQSYAAGAGWTTPVAVGDFNRDGILDIVAVNYDAETVSVLLGKGDGTFAAAPCFPIGGPMAVGDFNGDGIPDLAVLSPGKINILLGKGDGTFAAGPSYAIGHPSAVAVGDFDGDGRLDIAVAVTGAVKVLRGNGDGTFQAPQSYNADDVSRGRPTSLAVGDFNGDRIPDLVVAISRDTTDRLRAGRLSVLLGNGDGTFQTPLIREAGYGPNSVAVGDFNGDGKLDVVTTNYAVRDGPRGRYGVIVEDDVRVFLGNGDGTFQTRQGLAASGSGPYSVAVGDFNGDGISDLAVTNFRSNTVSVLLGNGDATFQVRQYQVGSNPQSVAIGDFNGDGILDLAAHDGHGVSILLGNGDGTFQTAQSYPAGLGGQIAVADLNNDGLPDLLLARYFDLGFGSYDVLTVLLGAP